MINAMNQKMSKVKLVGNDCKNVVFKFQVDLTEIEIRVANLATPFQLRFSLVISYLPSAHLTFDG